MEHLRDDGYTPWVVERRIGPFTRDLFGCIDLLAIRGTVTLAIQVTSGDNHPARARKVMEAEHLPMMLAAGWLVEVWSYRKLASGRYARRVERINGPSINQVSSHTGQGGDLRTAGQDEPGQAAGLRAAAAQVTA